MRFVKINGGRVLKLPWIGLALLLATGALLPSAAHAAVSYDAGLMNNQFRFDPGFDSAANKRWTYFGDANVPVYPSATSPKYDAGHWEINIDNAITTYLVCDSPSLNYVSVAGGETCRFEYWRFTNSANTATGLAVYWYDSGNAFISADTRPGTAIGATGAWLADSYTVTAPKRARRARIIFTMIAGAANKDLYVDGLAVYPLGTAAGVFWPVKPNMAAYGDSNSLITNYMPLGFARKTRTGLPVGTQFAVRGAGAGDTYANGVSVTSFDTYWPLAAGGANATLDGNLNIDSFVTVVSKTAPDGVFGLMATSQYPVRIDTTAEIADGVSGFTSVPIAININVSKSTEEKVYLRYSSDTWATSSFIKATGTETTYTATIPSVPTFSTINYYAFTSTADTSNGGLVHARVDYVTLSKGDSLAFTTVGGVGPTINSWHTVGNNSPDTVADADLYMRTATSSAGDTMWPRRRTTDNPVTFWVGMAPATDTPRAKLVYCTAAGTWSSGIDASETVTIADSIYFRFVLNQADNNSFDYADTVAYYFTLIAPAADSTYVHGNGVVDNVNVSDSTKTEVTARANPFIYRIRETRPTIAVTVPANNHDTGTVSFQIIGAAAADARLGDTVVIHRNGVPQDTVYLNASLAFVGWCTVAAKSDSVTVKLISDSFGYVAWDTIRVSLYTTPTITMHASPADGLETSQANFRMSGTSTNGRPGDSVTIFRNGVATDTVPVDGAGNWNGICSLAGKGDSIGVRLVNFLGNIAWDTPRKVTFNYHKIGASWVGIIKGDWTKYADTIYNDGTAGYTEIVDDQDSYSGYMYYNNSTDWLWFRIALDAKDTITWEHSPDKIKVFGWMLWIDVNMDGFADWQLGLTPFNAGNGLAVSLNSNNDQDFSDAGDLVTYNQTNSYKSNGTDSIWIEQIPAALSVNVNGDSDIYLAFGAPLSAYQSVLAPPGKRIYETTPFRILYGTGSSPNSIKRDLNGASQGNEASAFSGAQIVTTASFTDGASSRPGGMIYDTRDANFPTENGSWVQSETIYFSGFSWPRTPSIDSITVRIVLAGLDTNTLYSKQGTISYDTVGSFTGRGFWKPSTSNPAGIYHVWVKHPIAGDTYYFYDQFTLTARITSTSAVTQAPAQATQADSIQPVLRDTDQNSNAATTQTVLVTFTNSRTGETEVRTLTETGVNSGYFSGTTTISASAADSLSGSGKIFGRAGDTITIAYTDVNDTADTSRYSSVLVVPASMSLSFRITDATGAGPITLLSEGDTLGVRLIDRGLNRDALAVETYTVQVRNTTTGETENVQLVEAAASADTFFGFLATDTVIADSLSQSGIIFATLTQKLTVSFVDPYSAADSGADTVTMLGNGLSATRITDGSLVTIDTVRIGAFVYFEVMDRNRNGDPGAQDVISVTVRTSSGDSQNVQILESANNSGIFRSVGYFVTDSGPVTIGDSILTAAAGSTITCTYVDSVPATDSSIDTAIADTTRAAGSLIDSTGATITSLSAAESISIRAFDLDENRRSAAADTIRVTVTNPRTGEVETAVLIETAAMSGGYETGTIGITQVVGDSVSGDGAIMLLSGETFIIDYADRNDAADTFRIGVFTVVPRGATATGSFPASVRLGDSIVPIVTDTDQNLAWDRVETITVTVTNTRTGETEVITLYETDSNSGVFDTTRIRVTGDSSDSVDNDTLYALAGDPITVIYVDPTDELDVLTGGPFPVYLDTSPSSCTQPPTVRIGVGFEPTLTDTDQNLNGAVTNSITVVATNSRTGETEVFTLYETEENSGVFDNTTIPVTGTASDTVVNGKLYAAQGDTITVRYVDPTDPTDSVTSVEVRVVRDTSPAAGYFPSSVRPGDSIWTIITDTDQNRSELIRDTVAVLVTNNRTGETEVVVLYETNPYSGSFDSPLLKTSSNAADTVDNDTLYALAGDTITVRYVDDYDTFEIVTSGAILVVLDSSASSGTFPANVKSGDSIVPVVTDTDQNLDGRNIDTISALVTNERTGETEIVILYETDSNSGVFDVTRLPVRESISDSVDNDTLYAVAGDTITVRYIDPTDPSDSVTGGPFAVYNDTTASSGVFPAGVNLGDSLVPIIRDTDQNFSGTRIDSISVTVTNNRTGETEIIVLYETDSNSNVFDVTRIFVTGNIGDSVDNDTLYALFGDSISISYTDPTDTTDTIAGGPIQVYNAPTASSGTFPATVKIGDSIVPVVTDTDQNLSPLTPDTITVTVTNNRTGETEVITLFETDSNSNIFDITKIFITNVPSDSVDNDTLYAPIGDTISIRYTDPTDAGDSVNSAVITVVSAFTPAVMSADSRVTIGDSYYVRLVDANVNANNGVEETVTVTITNPATGETEVLTLIENNLASSLFDSTSLRTSSNPADSGSGSGKIYVRIGDTLIVTYTDPYDPTDTELSDTGIVRQPATTADSIIPAQFTIGSPLSGIAVIDTNANRDVDYQETVSVILTNSRTGETEALVLYESGSINFGHFDTATLTTSGNIADSLSNTGTLYAIPSDTVTVTYQDGEYPGDTFFSHGILAVPAVTASSITSDSRFVIGDSFLIKVTDGDADRNVFVTDTVSVTITNPATGETESIILTESGGLSTGIFNVVKLGTTNNPADSTSSNGTMYVRLGDTLLAVYVDRFNGTDSCRVDTGKAILAASAVTHSVPAVDTIGTPLANVIVYDTNANTDIDLQDTILVTVRNERTGETETLVLYESGTQNGFVFDTSNLTTSINVADSLSSTGTLYIRVGDTLTVRYTDAYYSLDSFVSSATLVVPALTTGVLKITDPNGDLPVVIVSEGDTIGIRLVDGNRNRDALATETLVIILTNVNSGETEPVTLTELGANSDTFFGIIGSETTGADSVSNTGRLFSAVPHVLTVVFADPYAAGDFGSDTVDVIGYGRSAVRIVNGSFTTTETFALGATMYVEVIDRNRNVNPNAKDTVQATVWTTSGDTEILTIEESANNTSIFRFTYGLVVTDSGAAVNNDTILFVSLPATITLTYTDPNDPTDSSFDTGAPVGSYGNGALINASGAIIASQSSSDSIRVRANDLDENRNPGFADTVAVTLTNGRTGETEIAILIETAAASGGFETNAFPLSRSFADSLSNSGALMLLNGDTLLINYRDRNDATDSFTLGPYSTVPSASVATGAFVTSVIIGQNATATVTDGNRNAISANVETVAVVVTNNRSGETASVTLTETAAWNGAFSGFVTTSASGADSGAGLPIHVLAGDTITIRYVDADYAADSITLGPAAVIQDTSASSGAFPPSIEPGADLGPTIRDTDANVNGSRVDTLVVLVTNNRTGETELLVLIETDSNSGVFNITKLATSTGLGDSGPLSGVLRILPGDTLTVVYADTEVPTDSTTSPIIPVTWGETTSSGTFPSSIEPGISLGPIIRDTDANRNGTLVDTLVALVTNNRTGETELLVLTETDSNSGVFNTIALPTSTGLGDSGPLSGTLRILPGDTLSIRYTDTETPTDSTASGNISVVFGETVSSGTFPTTIEPGASIGPVIRDTDANTNGSAIDTVAVLVTNNRTGETELLVLTETDSNSGEFDVTKLPTSTDPGDSLSLSGALRVLPGDTLLIVYVDTQTATDSSRSGNISVVWGETASAGTFPATIEAGTSVGPIIRDTDVNVNGTKIDTVIVLITNNRTGESELLLLTETDSNSGIFNTATLTASTSPADSLSLSGALYVLVGDTVSIVYVDTQTATDSSRSGNIGVILGETTSSGAFPTSIEPFQGLWTSIRDTDANLSGLIADTVVVLITNHRTGETELLVLTETGTNSGEFNAVKLPTTTGLADSLSLSGALRVLPGDTLSIVYVDTQTPTDSSRSGNISVVWGETIATGTFPSAIEPGLGVGPVIRDTDANTNGTIIDTVVVLITNNRTGETELLVLIETDSNSGEFDVTKLPTSTGSGDSLSLSGALRVLPGDTVTIAYVDTQTATDSTRSGNISVSFGETVSSGTFPSSVEPGASLGPIIRDTDANANGNIIDTVVVLITNNRTGETELLVLTEADSNSGQFDVPRLPTSTGLGDSLPLSGTLRVLPGDTLSIVYVDTQTATDSSRSGNITVVWGETTSAGTYPATIEPGFGIGPTIRDTDVNVNGTLVDTLVVLVTNNRTGETELLVLTETDSNSGVFSTAKLATSTSPGDSLSLSGTLRVLPGDTVSIAYVDTQTPTDSARSGNINVIFGETISSGTFPSAIEPFQSVSTTIRDSDANANGTLVDTVVVLVTNNRTGETELVILTETDSNSGEFNTVKLPTTTGLGDSLSLSGTLRVLPGDTLSIVYVDTQTATDSTRASAIPVAWGETTSSGAFPATIEAGLSIGATIRDTDANANGTWIDTVVVLVANNRTGETELLVLTETDSNTGVFNVLALATSSNVSDSLAFSGTLYIISGDTLSIVYVDTQTATDSSRSGNINVIFSETVSAGTFPSTVEPFEGIRASIRDTDANVNGAAIDTLVVLVTNNRTGETELLVLTETAVNSGIFNVTTLPSTTGLADSVSLSGALHILPGDTLSIVYVDTQTPIDSTRASAIPVAWRETGAAGAFPNSVKQTDSLAPIIRDTDANANGVRQDTLVVAITNNRTGETETLVLFEVGDNSGVFDTATLTVSGNASDSPAGSGALYGRAGDTLTIRYQDPQSATDSVASAGITVFLETSTASCTFAPATIRPGETVTPVLTDTDENRDALVRETVIVTIVNNRSGETEILVLTETDSNSGIFDSAVFKTSSFLADSVAGNDSLYIVAGDTLTIRYQDATHPADSLATATIAVISWNTNANGVFPSIARIGDSLLVIITDTDQNANTLLAETIVVTVTNNRTGETEAVVLTETGLNASLFDSATLPISGDAADSATGSGRIHVLAGDTLTIRYIDPDYSSDSISGTVTCLYPDSRSAGVFPPELRIDDSVTAIIIDTDQNLLGLTAETVSVTITNLRTGETELLTLREIGPNSGYFGGADTLPITASASDSVSGSGRIYAEGGDTIRISYTDPTDTADTLAREIGVARWAIAAEPLGVNSGFFGGLLRWADYDRDGDLDLAVSGQDNTTGRNRLIVYRNDGAAVFTAALEPMGANEGVRASSLDWGDYDNDGDLDLVVAGLDNAATRRLIVFRYDGGVFANAAEPMGANKGLAAGAVQWGDYDNDGDLDFFATGLDNSGSRRLIVFKNTAGAFAIATEPGAGLSGDATGASSSEWGDYDRDGDLDLLVSGRDQGAFNPRLVVWRNDRGIFTAVAEPMGANQGVVDGAVAWTDYDADGDLDFIAAGFDGTNRRLILFRNDGGATFTAAAEPMGVNAGAQYSTVRWGDYDNDGDADFAVAGHDGTDRRFILFRNAGGGVFTNSLSPFGSSNGLTQAALEFADYDRDGDLDLGAIGDDGTNRRFFVLKNFEATSANVRPAAPTLVTADSAVFFETVTVSWNAVTADSTPSAALTYNIRVGATSGGVSIVSADTIATDTVGPVVLGNVQNGESAVLYITAAGAYYWAVQAVDGGMLRGPWSGERVFIVSPSTVSSGSLASSVKINDSVTVVITDSDANRSASAAETVTVTVTNTRTGETEALTLIEQGLDSGRFGGIETMVVSSSAADSVSASGRLFVLAGDTITARYFDPEDGWDSVTLGPCSAYWDTSVAAGAFPTTILVGGTLTPYIADTDENRDGLLRETAVVTITNNRTGETETLVLIETDSNSGVFDSSAIQVTNGLGDSPSGSGRIFAVPTDTLTIRYVDRNHATDSVVSADIRAYWDTAPSSGVFPPSVRLGDSVVPVITDSDENRNGTRIDSITVTLTNNRTGETEIVILYETDSNSGVFDVTRIYVAGTPSDSVDNDTLYGVVADTITVRYVDPNDPADSVTGGPFLVTLAATPASGVIPPSIRIGDSILPLVHDTDQNLSGTTVDTVTVTVTNNRTGETEVITLFETDSNSGSFDVSRIFVTGSSSDSVDNDTLFVLAGDTVTIRYVDPTDPADSYSGGPVTAYWDTSAATGAFPPSVKSGDSIVPVVSDTDQNLDGGRIDTIAVTIRNERTGETEIVILYETDSNSGVFDVTRIHVAGTPGDSVDNDTLYALSGDTITVRYTDPTDPSDSLVGGPFSVIHDTVPSTGTFPPSVKSGDSIVPIVRDTDQNLDGARIDTIAVVVRNQRTGESEIVILYETDSNSGVFDVTRIYVTGAPGDSVDNDTLYALAGDTITVTYTDPTDPTDSITGGPFSVFIDTAPGSGTFPPNVKSGDSIVPIIRDTDQNLDGGRIDTIAVTIRNERTGETEIVILYETDSNSGVFDVTRVYVTGTPGDSVDNDTLYALSGDTITVRYTDPTDPSDSLVGGPFSVIHDTVPSTGTFPPSVKIGDSIVPIVRDTDQNLDGARIDTIAVVVRNQRTGETEIVILYETDSNSGVFDVTRVYVAGTPGDSVDNDTLYALAGDTITVTYTDPTDPADVTTGGPFSVFIDTAPGSGTFPPNVKSGDSIVPIIRDTDQNLDGTRIDTIAVIVRNNRTGETEIVILYETDSNSGVFDVTRIHVTGTPGDSVDNDTLYALSGDTITVVYTDPNDPTDVVTGGPFSVTIDSSGAAGLFVTEVRIGDSITPIVRDSDQNLSGLVRDTITVTITNTRTGETEVIVLIETDSNSGVFDVTSIFISSNPSDSVDNDTLFGLAGDTITVRYVDPNDPSDSAISTGITVRITAVASSLTISSALAAGDTAFPTVIDSDQNRNALAKDTVAVIFRNSRTGETETLVIEETADNSGVFDVLGLRFSKDVADSLSGTGRLTAWNSDTVVVTYGDPDDVTDSSTATVRILSSFTGSIQQIAVYREKISSDTYRFYFVPTNASGDTQPGLNGEPFTAEIVDSVGGTGRFTEFRTFLSGDSTVYHYNRVESAKLWLKVTLLGETFYPITIISGGDSNPTVVVGRRDTTNSEGILIIPDGYYDTEEWRLMVEPYFDYAVETEPLKYITDAANEAMRKDGARTVLPISVRPEHQFLIRNTRTGEYQHDLDTWIEVSITYPDATNDGIVDGTTVSEATLQMYYLDEAFSRWIVIPGATIDMARNVATIRVRHLTIFTLVGVSTATNAGGVNVYPNPWRPNDGVADNGSEYVAGVLTTGILMDNVPAGSRIRVMTTLGERVFDRVVATGGTYQWDVRNEENRPVQSGVYLVIIEAPNGTRHVEKIAVIR
jgi:hypothetical protein